MAGKCKIPHIALIIPARLMMDKELSYKEMMLMGILAATQGVLPCGSTLTITEMCLMLGRTRQAMYGSFAKLRELKYIENGTMHRGAWQAIRLTKKYTKMLDGCLNIR